MEGFRRIRSTLTALVDLTEKILSSSQDAKCSTLVLSIDLKKAFDATDQRFLTGVSGKLMVLQEMPWGSARTSEISLCTFEFLPSSIYAT